MLPILFQQSAGILVVMASAPDPTCVPVRTDISLPAVEPEQEVSSASHHKQHTVTVTQTSKHYHMPFLVRNTKLKQNISKNANVFDTSCMPTVCVQKLQQKSHLCILYFLLLLVLLLFFYM